MYNIQITDPLVCRRELLPNYGYKSSAVISPNPEISNSVGVQPTLQYDVRLVKTWISHLSRVCVGLWRRRLWSQLTYLPTNRLLKSQIRLRGYAGWSESSRGAYVTLWDFYDPSQFDPSIDWNISSTAVEAAWLLHSAKLSFGHIWPI